MYSLVREFLPRIHPTLGNRFGIEIEMEGPSLPLVPDSRWRNVFDGSLRGNNTEYVLEEPLNSTECAEQIQKLVETLKNSGSIAPSDRCGIHIHVNVQNLRLNQLYNMLMLYFIVESLLIDEFSPERKGNLFCLDVIEAEGLIDIICQKMRCRPSAILERDERNTLKYAALNIEALQKFGTLEFRAISTPPNPDELQSVIRIIRLFSRIKARARQYTYPINIIEDFSRMGPIDFFAKNYPMLNQKHGDLEERLFSSMRLVQEIAYGFPVKRSESSSPAL